MEKKPFKWNYLERCEGELQKLIEKRRTPEFIEGVQCAYDHQFEEAQILFEKYVLVQPQDSLGFYFLADIISKRFKKSATAEFYFMKSLMLNKSNNLNGNLQVGMRFFRMGCYNRAVEYLSKANNECYFKSRNPSEMLRLILDSDTLESKVLNSDEQIRALEKEENDNKEGEQYDGVGDLFSNTRSDSKQIKIPEVKILKLQYALTYSFVCLNEVNSALQQIDICIEIDQKNQFFKLCKLFLDQDKPRKERIKEILELNSTISKIKQIQIDLLPPKIKETLNCFKNKKCHSGQCFGYCFFLEGLSQDDLHLFEMAQKQDPLNNLFRFITAKKMAKSGQVKLAIENLKQIIKSAGQSHTADAQAKLGKIYFQKKSYEQALKHYQNAFSFHSHNLKILLKIAQSQFRLKRYQLSLSTLNKMDEFNEILVNIRESLFYQRAKSLWKCDEPMQGLRYLERIKKVTKQKVVYLEGVLHFQLKNYQQAIEKFQLCKGNTTIKNNHSYYLLGEIALATGEPIKQAQKLFEMELKYDPSFVPAAIVLGKIHYDMGNLQASFNVLFDIKCFEEVKDESIFRIIVKVFKKLRLFSELSLICKIWQKQFPNSKKQKQNSIDFAKNSQFQFHDYETAIIQHQISDKHKYMIDVQFQIAMCLIEVGQPERALIILNNLLEISEQVCYLFSIGSIYLNRKEYNLAVDFIKKGLLINPCHVGGLSDLASACLYGDRNYKEAIRIYKKCLLQDDVNSMIYFNLGVAYRKLKKIQKAQLCFEAAVRINANFQCAKLFLGFIQFSQGKIEKAYENLKSIPKPPVKATKYFYCLARLKAGVGCIGQEVTLNYEQSILSGFQLKYFSKSIEQVLDKSTSIDEFSYWINIMLGQFQSKTDVCCGALFPDLNKFLGMAYVSIRNKFKQAKTHLLYYLSVNPFCEISKIRLARCDFELNQDLNSIQSELSNKLKSNIEYQLLKADVYNKQSKFQLANRKSSSWTHSIVKPRLLLETKYVMARSHIMDGEVEKGIDLLNKNSHYAPSQALLGDLKLEKGDEIGAINCYKESLILDSSYATALKQIGSVFFKQANYLEASKYLELFHQKSENFDLEAMFQLAKSCYELKKYSNSIKLGKLIIKKFPDYCKAYLILGQSHAMLGKYQAGSQILQKGLTYSPLDDEMWYNLSICEEKLGNDQDAKESLHECVRLDPNSITYWSNLGDIYLKMNDYEIAKQQYDQCLSLESSNKNSLLKLAQIASEQSGQHSEALAYIEHCLKYHSNDQDAILFKFKLFIILGKTKNINDMFLTYEEHFKNDPELSLRIIELFMKNPNLIELEVMENQLENLELNHIQNISQKIKLKNRKQLRLAQLNYMLKRITQAEKYIKKFNKSSVESESINEFLGDYFTLKAQIAFQKGNHPCVLSNMKKSIRVSKGNSQEQRKAALVYYLAEQNSNKGKILFDQLRKTGIQSEIQSIAEGVILLNSVRSQFTDDATEKKKVLAKAISIFKLCLETYLNCSLASYYIADCYAQQGDLIQAKQAYSTCIALQSQPLLHPLNDLQKLRLTYKLALLEQSKDDINQTIMNLVAKKDIVSIIEYTEILFARGDKLEAMFFAKKALKLDPENARMYYIRGKCSQNEMEVYFLKRCQNYQSNYPQIELHIAQAFESCGDIEDALTFYLSQLSYKDPSMIVIEKCVLLLTQLSKYSLAQTLLSNYLKLHTNLTPTLYVSQANLYRRQGMIDQSIQKLKESLALYPNHVETYISLSFAYEEKGDLTNILALLSELIQCDTFKSEETNSFVKAQIYNTLGNTAAFLGFYETSITNYGFSLNEQQRDNNRQIQINIVLCWLVIGEFEKAKELLDKIIDSNQKEIKPIFYLGVAHQLMEQNSLAIKYYQKCLIHFPQFTSAAINLAILLRKANNYNEAIRVLFPFQKWTFVQIKPLYHLALTYFQAGEWNNAIGILLKLIQNYESIAESNKLVVEKPIKAIYPMSKRNNTNNNYAISYQQSDNSIPTKEQINLLLSRVYRKQNRIDNEQMLLENCLVFEPNNPKYIFTYAVSKSIANKKYSGRDEYSKCIHLDPSRKALYLLATSAELHEKGKYVEEVDLLKEIIELNPGFEEAHTNLGAAYFKLNDLPNSLKEYQKVIEWNRTNPDNHFNLGNIYLRMKNIDLAIDSYQRAISLNSNHILALNNLGIAFKIKNNYQESADCFQKCIQIDPFGIEKYSNSLKQLHKLIYT